jgi:shikimate dehydrogenase
LKQYALTRWERSHEEAAMKQIGLIGLPVAHSLSPRMQQAAFDASGLAARYVLWETQPEALPARVASLRAPEVPGANVTLPYKTDVLALVDAIEPLAARVGAINTIVNRNGRLIGYNTDVQGLLHALAGGFARPFDGRGKCAVLLGTGGAARAAAVGLIESGVKELIVLGRTEAHLHALCQHLQNVARPAGSSASIEGRGLASSRAAEALARADMLINATSVGLAGKEQSVLIDVAALPTDALVLDMIFHPPETPLLRAAKAHGCRTLNGLTMLLYQGALAFEHWTGQTAPIEAMRQALGC